MRPEWIRRRLAGLTPWEKLAAAIWAAIVAVISGRVFFWPRTHTVYPIFANAARHWVAGADTYGPISPSLDFYRYSPLVTTVFVPFSRLPDSLGNVVWRLLSAAIFLTALAWWCQAVLPQALTRTQRALLFLLVVPMAIGSLNNGQSNVLMLGLLLAGTAAVAAERWQLAGVCAALACLFKVYPIAVGLLVASLYPRRFAGWLVLALSLGLLAPFVLQSPGYVASQYAHWIAYLQTDDRQSMPLDQSYRDFRLLCRLWQRPLDSRTYLAIQLAVASGIASLCLAGRFAGWSQRRLLTLLFGLGCCWMTVFGPATESSTYILLAPTLAGALLETWSRPRTLWTRAILLTIYALFVLAQVGIGFPGQGRFALAALKPLAGLLLFVHLLITALRRPIGSPGGIEPADEPASPARAA